MERAIEYLLKTSDEEIGRVTLRDVSKALKMSAVLLSVVFILTRKETFAAYVERERLHRAAYHLDHNREPDIEEISKRLGFASREIFSKKFDKYYLVKPERFWQLRQLK